MRLHFVHLVETLYFLWGKANIYSSLYNVVFNNFDVVTDAKAAGPHSWGPPLEAASKERLSLGGPNYTKGRIIVQIGNNRIISLLPYQESTATQIQVNGI